MYLVIDDDQVFAETLTRGLKRRGFDALNVQNKSDALASVENNRIQRVVLDLKIGAESGLTLLPELLGKQKDLQIILLTGYSSIPTAVEAIKMGAKQYLCKPASLDEIISAFDNRQNESNFTELPKEPHSVERLEWEHIQKVLMENQGNISATARALGMHRRTLQRKLLKRPVHK